MFFSLGLLAAAQVTAGDANGEPCSEVVSTLSLATQLQTLLCADAPANDLPHLLGGLPESLMVRIRTASYF